MPARSCMRGTICKYENKTLKVARNAFNTGDVWNPVSCHGNKTQSKLKRYVKPMKDPLGISPSKENQGTTRGKEKILLTSVGIEPTTSGLDLPLLCRLSFEVSRTEKVGDDLGGESRQRESIYTFI